MATYRMQCIIPMVSGVSKDAAQNVWYFTADDSTNLTNAVNALDAFYSSIDGVYSNLVATTGARMKVYDLADPEPRAPVLDVALSVSSVGGDPAPTECAIAVSFQATRVSGAAQNRRRGRVYIGPLQKAAIHTDGRPTSSTISGLVTAADTLLTASKAASGWSWVVFSRANDAPVAVDNGWVDNEFDTQRRRGREATSRSTFS